jgi:hypothetical protein
MPTITRANAAAFRRPLTRPDPALPAAAMKTYSVVAPLDSHWRPASCEQVGCLAHHNGFQTRVDESTDLGARQAAYVRQRAGRPFSETREDGVTVFTFPPGTECFTQHKTRRSRPLLYVVRNGDWRSYLGRPQIHTSPDAWIDDFASHQDRLAKVRS